MSRRGPVLEHPETGPFPPRGGGGPVPRAGRELIVVGASVRAAAHSAVRAGLAPLAFDRFGDADLRAVAAWERLPEVEALSQYRERFGRAPGTPWMYTGAWENEPVRVDVLARMQPLWGNLGAVLRRVRDPGMVVDALRRAGHRAPEVRTDAAGLSRDGGWLMKPLRSAGGRDIARWTPAAMELGEACYFQRRVDGRECSAVFCGANGTARLLGMTLQLLGRPTAPFGYAGSIGPWRAPAAVVEEVEAMGRTLAGEFGLRGLFGVDLVVSKSEVWAIEVNPRYTASVEVLELGLGRSLLAEHAAVFEPGFEGSRGGRWSGRVVGKAVLYARGRCEGPRGRRPTGPLPRRWSFERPDVADWPAPGTTHQAGWPVLTVFAAGASEAVCRARLGRLLRGWERHLEGLRGRDCDGAGDGSDR